MRLLTSILFFLSINTAFAAKVVEVIHGETRDEDSIVKWSDGRVTFMKQHKAEKLEIAPLPLPDVKSEVSLSYEPTILSSSEEARKLLRAQKKPAPIQWNIQCYNMAHVRAYEAWKHHKVKSSKIFLFFTKSYIRKYRFKWWFHVTPMVHVKANGKVDELVLDREWSKVPLSPKAWSDIFVKSKKTCPVISKYSSYEQNQESNDCYVYPAPMYYWQPIHLMELESDRNEMTGFHMGQVNTAYSRDF